MTQANNSAILRRTIRPFYWIGGFTGFVLYYALDKILMQARGLRVSEIVLIEIVFSVITIVLEVPMGALADRWKRKYVLALHSLCFMLNTAVWAFAHSLPGFLLGALFAALSVSLYSGTMTSLLYDTLLEINCEKEYSRVYGMLLFYDSVGLTVGSIIGSMIASRYGLAAPFWLTLIPTGLALLLTLRLREPAIHRPQEEVGYWQHIAQSFRTVTKNRKLVRLAVIAVALEAALTVVHEYGQLYYVAVGVPIFYLGYLGAIATLLEAIGAKYSSALEAFTRARTYSVSLALTALSLILACFAYNLVGVILLFMPILASYFVLPLLSEDIHDSLPSHLRATSESFVNLAGLLFLTPLLALFGLLSDGDGIRYGYLAVGLVMVLALLLYWWSRAVENDPEALTTDADLVA